MGDKQEENRIPVSKKENKTGKISKNSVILTAVILSVIAASVVIGVTGDDVKKQKDAREREEIIAQNDIRDIFAKGLALKDDDPHTDTIHYFLTDSPNYKETGRIKVRGLMLHSIGAAQTSAMSLIETYGASDFRYAGVHGFIDSETGEFYQTLPWSQQAWHAGDGASDYIAVEMCESDAGYYTDDFVFHPEDLKEAQRHTKTAYDTAVKLFARLCYEYELDPLQEGNIISHYEGSMMGRATKHGDPNEYWEYVESGYTMDGFRQDVSDYMNDNIAARLKYTPIRQILKKYIYHEKA